MPRLFLSLFIFATVSQGVAFATSPAVDVDLSECGMGTAAKFSGWMFEYATRKFVVTSSWAQMTSAGDSSNCEIIRSSDRRLLSRAIVTDHLAGLALYEILDSDLKVEPYVFTKKATLAIPSLNSYFEGQIITSQSRRHSIPLLDRALEWKGNPVGSEALGAGVVESAIWLGVVSHQVLTLIPGSVTISDKWKLRENKTNNHLIVIPTAEVLSWVQSQLAAPLERVIWPRQAQRLGEEVFFAGNLQFKARCPESTSLPDSGEFPIGGHDGFGIGGDAKQNLSCKIEVQKLSAPASNWLAHSLSRWSTFVDPDLQQGKEVTLMYGIRQGSNELRSLGIHSVEGLLKAALDPNTHWIEEVRPRSTSPDSISARAELLRLEVLKCYSDLYLNEDQISGLLRRLYLISLMASSSARGQLRIEDLDQVLDRNGVHKFAWKVLQGDVPCVQNKVRHHAEAFEEAFKKANP